MVHDRIQMDNNDNIEITFETVHSITNTTN